ncbi:hypothetical protein BVC80_1289g19 [Macleaya cordata]|uniref:GIR1-like zinc ribbon domain-containing protein n=1 Tax=Macleaya cordata TaxID=56857 RepID=A0A200Q9J3_MACCD|nr:hypothetical protein BVC80_1289g19 [Macleaya cordata]
MAKPQAKSFDPKTSQVMGGVHNRWVKHPYAVRRCPHPSGGHNPPSCLPRPTRKNPTSNWVQQHQKERKAHSRASGYHNEGVNNEGNNNFYGSAGLTHNLHDHHRVKPLPVTLDLFHSSNKLASTPVELEEPHPLPFGWQRFLDLQTGEIYYKKNRQILINESTETSRSSSSSSSSSSIVMSRNRTTSSTSPTLDLKLNLSPPRINVADETSANRSSATSSPTSSCLSTEMNYHVVDSISSSTNIINATGGGRTQESTTTASSNMLLVGCPRCLMYVMLSAEEQYPKCPKCKSSVLLDFLHHLHNNNNKKTRNN